MSNIEAIKALAARGPSSLGSVKKCECIPLDSMKDMEERIKLLEDENQKLKQYAENTHLGLTAFATVYEMQAIHGAGSHAALPENCLTTVQRTALAGLTEKKEV